MMSVQQMDELVQEYLLFRGFVGTLKAMEFEMKNDKDKNFRADKITELLTSYIHSYELSKLREYWTYLDGRLFRRLEQTHALATKKLEASLLKYYLVHAVQNNRTDKVSEFFEKLSNDLHSQPEWKDWFVLPFIKNPEENSLFSFYFSRQWQDVLLVSLHNFLEIIFHAMPVPTILGYEQELHKYESIQKELHRLHNQMKGHTQISEQKAVNDSAGNIDLWDDFQVHHQENDEGGVNAKSTSGIRNFIRNISSSPILGKKPVSGSAKSDLDAEKEERNRFSNEASVPKDKENALKDAYVDSDMSYSVVSQDEFCEHSSSVTHCRFNSFGTLIASADVDGCVKVWKLKPTVCLVASLGSRSNTSCIEWATNSREVLILGNKSGYVSTFDIKQNRVTQEVILHSASPRIVSLCCSPQNTSLVAATGTKPKTSLQSQNLRVGKLYVCSIQPLKILNEISAGLVSFSSVCFNSNGSRLIAGALDGSIHVFNALNMESIGSWSAHDGEIYSIQLNQEESLLYSMANDSKFLSWNMNALGVKVAEISIHNSAFGPFVHSGNGGYRQVQTPKGLLFKLNSKGSSVLTCAQNNGLIYRLKPVLVKEMQISGHKLPVVTVDWSCEKDGETVCLTGSMDGRIIATTLKLN